MKFKYFNFVIIGIAIVLLTTCNLTMASQNTVTLEKAPEVSITQGGIVVCLSEIPSDTKYAHLYRQEKISSKPDKYADPVNIGIVYPKHFSNPTICIYEDLNVYNEKTYIYFSKYTSEESVKTSYKSNEITALSGYNAAEDSLVYDTTDSYLEYNDETYSLTIKASFGLPDINNFEDEYTPMLLVKSDKHLQAFPISSIEEETIIPLRKTLSQDFFDKNISFEGVLGQKIIHKDNNEEKEITIRIWTKPSKIEVTNTSKNSVKIPSDKYADGYDYGSL